MQDLNKGSVYWLTGLSGAGKTTIGRKLYDILRQEKTNVIYLDGDVLREIFGNNFGYTTEERKKLALTYSRLCKTLSDQGIDVICATMSLFKEVHAFNRKNITNYYEVFIDCKIEELVQRDQKGIYTKALKGELNDVMGVNLHFDKPEDYDLIIENSSQDQLTEKVEQILSLIRGSKNKSN